MSGAGKPGGVGAMRLDGFDPAIFLRDYWQKRPLLIRNPWAGWRNPLAPDLLAGLACEEGVESRLIVGAGTDWTLEHGPFAESRFESLPSTGWTLLVQAVDHHVPDVAALLAPFRFIPDWRIDDVMVSYAADQGSAGPHYDQYDVFLIQGLGRRRWRIGGACNADTPLLPHSDLRLLADFETLDEWVLEPGDILYVPPGIAHHGIAVGDDCMTYSIGFRAPSTRELVAGWSEHLLAGMDEDVRYRDPVLEPQQAPGEISAEAIDGLYAMMAEQIADKTAFARWFGAFNSAPKYGDLDWRPERPVEMAEVRAQIAAGTSLIRNPASRFAFLRQDENALRLFVDGHETACSGESAAFARRLCADDRLDVRDLPPSEPLLELIRMLLNQGSVAFDNDEDD